MTKLALLVVLLTTIMVAVSLPTKADPTNCSTVSWKRPGTYVTGEPMPADKPMGYKMYFSSDPAPTKANSRIEKVEGANNTSIAIPASELNGGNGLFFVRGTAYNLDAEGKELESNWTANTVPFFLSAGTCFAPDTPSESSDLNLQFLAQ